jgi:hypothetical protein
VNHHIHSLPFAANAMALDEWVPSQQLHVLLHPAVDEKDDLPATPARQHLLWSDLVPRGQQHGFTAAKLPIERAARNPKREGCLWRELGRYRRHAEQPAESLCTGRTPALSWL